MMYTAYFHGLDLMLSSHDMGEGDLKPSWAVILDTHRASVGHEPRIPVLRWFQMLYSTFGSFFLLALLSYGLQQGFAHKSELFACTYIMMDTLKLDGATISRPWG